MWRKDSGLDLRLDPLLQTCLARVDQVVAGLGGIVVREQSCCSIFEAGMARVLLCRNLATFRGGSHGGGPLGGSWVAVSVAWVCGSSVVERGRVQEDRPWRAG